MGQLTSVEGNELTAFWVLLPTDREGDGFTEKSKIMTCMKVPNLGTVFKNDMGDIKINIKYFLFQRGQLGRYIVRRFNAQLCLVASLLEGMPQIVARNVQVSVLCYSSFLL